MRRLKLKERSNVLDSLHVIKCDTKNLSTKELKQLYNSIKSSSNNPVMILNDKATYREYTKDELITLRNEINKVLDSM